MLIYMIITVIFFLCEVYENITKFWPEDRFDIEYRSFFEKMLCFFIHAFDRDLFYFYRFLKKHNLASTHTIDLLFAATKYFYLLRKLTWLSFFHTLTAGKKDANLLLRISKVEAPHIYERLYGEKMLEANHLIYDLEETTIDGEKAYIPATVSDNWIMFICCFGLAMLVSFVAYGVYAGVVLGSQYGFNPDFNTVMLIQKQGYIPDLSLFIKVVKHSVSLFPFNFFFLIYGTFLLIKLFTRPFQFLVLLAGGISFLLLCAICYIVSLIVLFLILTIYLKHIILFKWYVIT